MSKQRFTRPVPQATGTPFGKAGSLWSSGYHTGLDFPAPVGQTVVACLGGKVTSATNTGGAYGNRVIIRHAAGFETWYCHLSEFNVKAGDVVHAGDHIGAVGATGNVTGPHLHLEVRVNGQAVDPAPYVNGTKLGDASGAAAGSSSLDGGDQLLTTRPVVDGDGGGSWGDSGGGGVGLDLGDLTGLTVTALVVLAGFGLVVVGAVAAASPRLKGQMDDAGDRLQTALAMTPEGAAAKGATKGATKTTKTPTKGMTA